MKYLHYEEISLLYSQAKIDIDEMNEKLDRERLEHKRVMNALLSKESFKSDVTEEDKKNSSSTGPGPGPGKKKKNKRHKG